ncbi:MAG: hypothetical protein AAF458_13045 [Pseudomonadota bacterium]
MQAKTGFSGSLNGWQRLAICLLALLAGWSAMPFLSLASEAALRWFDHLAPMPGLSGLVLLALAPIGFLVFVAALRWVLTGFRAPAPVAVTPAVEPGVNRSPED